MDTNKAITTRRSIRRFKQETISKNILMKLMEAARVAPSAMNAQPLKYLVIDDKSLLLKVFETLSWAGYIAPHGTPPEGQKPVAYIIVLLDDSLKNDYFKYDIGAAVENILLSATDQGLGSCWVGSVNRNVLQKSLAIPNSYYIDSVIALGYPDQGSQVEELKDSIKYWRDDNGDMHIPKRALKEIMYYNVIARSS
ncbi:MAG: nitroreductase family protein [bacterium]